MNDRDLRRVGPSDRQRPIGTDGGEESDRASGCDGRMGDDVESTQTKWTNEKHSMYLNYMEETFVNQLYSCDYHLTDSLGCPLRIQNNLHPSGPTLNGFYSSQFTSHRSGSQEKSNFQRLSSYNSMESDPCFHSSNTCVQHLSSYSSGYRASSSSMQLPSPETDNRRQSSVGSTIEMSDQNFVDNNCNGEKHMRRTTKNRRMKNAASTATQIDKVTRAINVNTRRNGSV